MPGSRGVSDLKNPQNRAEFVDILRQSIFLFLFRFFKSKKQIFLKFSPKSKTLERSIE